MLAHRSYLAAASTSSLREQPRIDCGRRVVASMRSRPVARSGKGASGGHPSFDSDDEMDGSLAAELNAKADPSRVQRMSRHLELLWKIGKRTKPETCAECRGTGEKECDWCHGTGVMTVGDSLFCSTATHSNRCPVCKAEGSTKCENCRGTGFRAKWLGTASSPGESSGRIG